MKKLKLWIKKKSKLNLGQKKYYEKIVDDAMKKKGLREFLYFFLSTPILYFQSVNLLLGGHFRIFNQ